MRKTIYFAAIFVALAFVFTGCGKKSDQAGQGAGKTSDVEEFQATIQEMAAKGKPYRCEYRLAVDDIDQKGVIYFGGPEKIRGDLDVTMPNNPMTKTHFIKDGETQYIWSDGQPGGIKMTITKEEEEEFKKMAKENQGSVDMDTKVTMKCSKWSPDAGMFAPPSGIEFQDFSDMMKSLQGASAGADMGAGSGEGANEEAGGISSGDINMCNICNQIPAGAARDSCRAQNCD